MEEARSTGLHRPPRAVLIASLPTIVIFPALRRSFAGGMIGAVK